MLAYLDNSDLSWLERLSRQNADQYRALIADWQQKGCEFAFSFHHVQETAQLADPASIEARQQIIGELGQIRFASSGALGVMELEIEAQLLALASRKPPDFGPVRDAAFPISSASAFSRWSRRTASSFRSIVAVWKRVRRFRTQWLRRTKSSVRLWPKPALPSPRKHPWISTGMKFGGLPYRCGRIEHRGRL